MPRLAPRPPRRAPSAASAWLLGRLGGASGRRGGGLRGRRAVRGGWRGLGRRGGSGCRGRLGFRGGGLGRRGDSPGTGSTARPLVLSDGLRGGRLRLSAARTARLPRRGRGSRSVRCSSSGCSASVTAESPSVAAAVPRAGGLVRRIPCSLVNCLRASRLRGSMPLTARRMTSSGAALEHFGQRARLEPTRIAGVTVVALGGSLVPRYGDLLGIHDYNEIARVHMRRVGGLALAAQHIGDLRREPAERSPFGIDDQPVALSILWCGYVGLHGTHKRRVTRAACPMIGNRS